MAASCRYEAIHATLRRLEQYSTLSPFCRIFYRLIYDLLGEPAVDSDKLKQAFHLFLRCECRRHHAIHRIVQSGELDLAKIIRSGRKTHDILERLTVALRGLKPGTRQKDMVRELILAECNYHLGRTGSVVRELRRAIRMGCDHPLVHFALGYNLYAGAVQRFTRAGDRKGTVALKDPAAFHGACRQAIAAFEQGLGYEAYDAQIHWWMGLIWEILGERDSACDAFRQAMEADPENLGEQVKKKLESLERRGPPLRSPEESERLSKLGPITEDDLRYARELLDACNSFPSAFSEF